MGWVMDSIFAHGSVPVIPRFTRYKESENYKPPTPYSCSFSWLFLKVYTLSGFELGVFFNLLEAHNLFSIMLRLPWLSVDIIIPWPFGLGFRLYGKDHKERYKEHKRFMRNLYSDN